MKTKKYFKNDHTAFTLVEILVVITILAILATIAFISLQGYSRDAKNSKILYDVRNLTSLMETNLSKGKEIGDLVFTNRKTINGINTGTTVLSGAYTLNSLSYEVGTFDFEKIGTNGEDFVYDDNGVSRDYIFGYAKAPEKFYYEFAGQTLDKAGKYHAIIKGNYIKLGSGDAIGLISENGSDIGLTNGQELTDSLY